MISEEVKEGIRSSQIFIALITGHWLEEPERFEELEYANSLGKPVALLIEKHCEQEAYGRLDLILPKTRVVGAHTFEEEDLHTIEGERRLSEFVGEIKRMLAMGFIS